VLSGRVEQEFSMSLTHNVRTIWKVGALQTTSYMTARRKAKEDSIGARVELMVSRNLSDRWEVKEVWSGGLQVNYVAGL
jgi:hypothetical protein